MITMRTLRTLPDDITVSEAKELSDKRLMFLITEYEQMSEDCDDLPPLDDDTTIREIKENLRNSKHPDLLRFLMEYSNRYLDDNETRKLTKDTVKVVMLVFIATMLVIILIPVLVIGLLRGDIDATAVITSFFDVLSNAIGSIINFLLNSPENY